MEDEGLCLVHRPSPDGRGRPSSIEIRLLEELLMAIRWEKLTVKAQEAVQRGNDLASEHGNPELLPLHVLAALLEDKEGIVQPVLEKIGIGPQAVLSETYREIERLPKVSGGGAAQATLSKAANRSSRPGLQGSRQLQGRICFHRAPAAGDHAPEARPGAGDSGAVRVRLTMPFSRP